MTSSPMSCASKARSGASLATKQVLLSRHLVPAGGAAPATTNTCLVGAAWQRPERARRLIQLLQVVLPLRSRGVCCRCPHPYIRPVAMQRPHAACQHESQQCDSLWREPPVVVTARRRQVRPAAAAAAVERRFVRQGRAAAAAAGWRRINSSGRLLHECHSSAGQDSRCRCGEAELLRTDGAGRQKMRWNYNRMQNTTATIAGTADSRERRNCTAHARLEAIWLNQGNFHRPGIENQSASVCVSF